MSNPPDLSNYGIPFQEAEAMSSILGESYERIS